MDELESRLTALEGQLEMARISEGVLRSVLTTTLGFIVLHHGEHGRAFVQGLKVHTEPIKDARADLGQIRPDYAERFRASVDEIADRALSATVLPLPPSRQG